MLIWVIIYAYKISSCPWKQLSRNISFYRKWAASRTRFQSKLSSQRCDYLGSPSELLFVKNLLPLRPYCFYSFRFGEKKVNTFSLNVLLSLISSPHVQGKRDINNFLFRLLRRKLHEAAAYQIMILVGEHSEDDGAQN